MTFSKIGIDGEIIQEINLRTGDKEARFLPHFDTTGKEKVVLLPKLSRLLGLYIIGLQGMGKSGLFEELILQDIKQDIGVCVLDPHGELVEHIIARLPDAKEEKVIYLDFTESNFFFGLNLFECSDPTNERKIAETRNQVLHVFEKAFGINPSTPLMYNLLHKTASVLIANPGYTMVDISLFLTNEAFRKKLIQKARPDIRDFWERRDDPKLKSSKDREEESQTILNKLNDFEDEPLRYIVGQSASTIDLRTIMDEGKILLVKLDRRLEQATKLVGSILVAQIVNAANTRQTNKLFNLYADEFQNFATEDFTLLLEQARKQGIGVTMAHQNRSQLELSNHQADQNLKTRTLSVGNIVVFRVPTDAESLAGIFDRTPPPSTETRKEQILTVKYDAVSHLLTNGYADKNGNTNKIIDAFISTKLIRLQEPADYQALGKQWLQVGRQKLNNLLYAVMSENNPYKEVDIDIFLFFYFTSYSSYPSLPYYRYEWYGPPLFLHILVPKFALRYPCNKPADDDEQEEYVYEPFWGERERELQKKWSDLRKQANESFPLLWTSRSDQEVKQTIQTLYQACCEVFPQYYGFLKSEGTYAREIAKIKEKLAYKPDALRQKQQEAERLENDTWFFTRTYEEYVRWMKSTRQKPIKKEREYLQEKQHEIELFCQALRNDIAHGEQQIASYRQEMPNIFAKAVAAETQEAIASLTKDSAAFEAAIFAFRSILQILSHDPIMGPSGQYEEKAISRTYSDRREERANELGRLPQYTARVLLSEMTGKAVEHVIKTIEPEKKGLLRGTVLQQRIASIHYRNLTDRYIRSRTEVEEEIGKRQGGQGNAPGANGPRGNDPGPKGKAGSPPPRRRKLDPDDEQKITCKQCGTLNDPDAAFCKKCGLKL